MKKKTILSSVIAIVLCLSLMTGSTFALFTSESKVNVAITSATVDVKAEVKGVETFSFDVAQPTGYFENGGTANVDNDGVLKLDKMTPGDKAKITIAVTNNSNVLIQYRVIMSISGELAPALKGKATIGQAEYDVNGGKTAWVKTSAANEAIGDIALEVYFPDADDNNNYQNKSANVVVTVEAVQGNAAIVDTWDGQSADTSWFFENPNATEYTLSTAAEFAGFAKFIEGTAEIPATYSNLTNVTLNFEGVTFELESDLDFAGKEFRPIGNAKTGEVFKGTFDGQGHTIANFTQHSNLDSNNGGWQYEGEYYGLFAYTDGATIKDVKISGAYISSGRNEAAAVVGYANNTTFSDITISDCTLIAYNNSAGGVAAECYGDCSFTNITVDADTVIGPLWGTYDVRLGGIVGLVHAGNNITFKDITVACKLDAINDVASNYQYWNYRYCGMLIGHVDAVNDVADPTGYVTCENVKVIYGDWVNYHYCEDSSYGTPSYADPGEYKFNRVEAGTGTGGIDLSACDHDADESHNVLIVFDQLFGGGQGVRGLKTYAGVTVEYPNN